MAPEKRRKMETKIIEARTAAYAAYAAARAEGKDEGEAAQAAWMAARGVLRHLRAPYWSEQVYANSGAKRSYTSPLGTVLGCYGYEFGGHSAKWPRTQRSYRESEHAARKVIAHLESTLSTVVAA